MSDMISFGLICVFGNRSKLDQARLQQQIRKQETRNSHQSVHRKLQKLQKTTNSIVAAT